MTTVNDVLDMLSELAPVSLKMDFDNVGLLVGDRSKEVNRLLIALDITDAVIDEAVALGAELIVSHHPLIFTPLKSVLSDDICGRKVIKLIENGISAICMHTNLDIVEGGINDVLIKALGAEPEMLIEPTGEGVGLGRVGQIPEPLTLEVFLERCKTALKVSDLRYVSGGKDVSRIGVMGGAGAFALENAVKAGCDTYITADIKYHEFLNAADYGINLIDGDHFCTENLIIPVLHEKLSAAFSEVSVAVSSVHAQTVRFF